MCMRSSENNYSIREVNLRETYLRRNKYIVVSSIDVVTMERYKLAIRLYKRVYGLQQIFNYSVDVTYYHCFRVLQTLQIHYNRVLLQQVSCSIDDLQLVFSLSPVQTSIT